MMHTHRVRFANAPYIPVVEEYVLDSYEHCRSRIEIGYGSVRETKIVYCLEHWGRFIEELVHGTYETPLCAPSWTLEFETVGVIHVYWQNCHLWSQVWSKFRNFAISCLCPQKPAIDPLNGLTIIEFANLFDLNFCWLIKPPWIKIKPEYSPTKSQWSCTIACGLICPAPQEFFYFSSGVYVARRYVWNCFLQQCKLLRDKRLLSEMKNLFFHSASC